MQEPENAEADAVDRAAAPVDAGDDVEAGDRHAGANADADAPRPAAEAGGAEGPTEEVAVVDGQVSVSWTCVCGAQSGAPGDRLAANFIAGARFQIEAQCCGRRITVRRKPPERLIQTVPNVPLNRQQRRALERKIAKENARAKGIGLLGSDGKPVR